MNGLSRNMMRRDFSRESLSRVMSACATMFRNVNVAVGPTVSVSGKIIYGLMRRTF